MSMNSLASLPRARTCRPVCSWRQYRYSPPERITAATKMVSKNPIPAPDGVTFYLLYECKFCPDMQIRVIKTAFNAAGKHTLVNLTYEVRGTMRVLSREEWQERNPRPVEGELKRETEL